MRTLIAKLLLLLICSLVGLAVFAFLAGVVGLMPKIWWGGEADISFGVNIDVLIIGCIPIFFLINFIFVLYKKKSTYKNIAIIGGLLGIATFPAEMVLTRAIKHIPGWATLAPWHALIIDFAISYFIAALIIVTVVGRFSKASETSQSINSADSIDR